MEGQVILAKMRTYAAWPAWIKAFGKSYVNVHFFGDETTGNVSFENVGMFRENQNLIQFNLQKKINGYAKAVRCAEAVCSVPEHLSIYNKI